MSRLAKGAALLSAIARASLYGMRDSPLRYWDVGARWGLSRPMHVLYRLGFVQPVFFEAEPTEAQRLKSSYRSGAVLACGLWHDELDGTLYMTSDPGQSSLLKPLATSEIISTCPVQLSRADTILKRKPELAPEIVKLDIQGAELAALSGFGDALNRVTALEIEVGLRAQYEDQPLAHSVTEFLANRGFGLFDIQVFGVRSTRGSAWANAFYFRREVDSARQRQIESVFRAINRIPIRA